ncbi:DCC1-like thiol-disulfide oxidoreductase family protein [Aestuariivirga sp.]|uniref:DCC1-like thiol-disulfide oxidoreductase family protein n=1 Tax=Aestuariivirga sp. TaxID=2650926 RepID=UPI003BA9531D
MIIADLIQRSRWLVAFYTDQGVLTRQEAIAFNNPISMSLYYIGGSPIFVIVLFCLAGIFAALVVVGYRTRLMTFLSWVFLLSICNRNLIVTTGADSLVTSLTFWSMFLPLGARFSFDEALRPDDQPQPENDYFSVATVAITCQVLFVYFFGALLKNGAEWIPNGTAVYFALQIDTFATPLAHIVREYGAVLHLLTYYVWFVELLAPLMALSLFWFVPLRLAAQLLMASLHLGFIFLLELGIFPFVSLTSLTLLTQAAVWDWFGRGGRATSQNAIKIYYDENCGFCLKVARIFRSFCLSPQTPILPAQQSASIRPIFEALNSWVVTDADGGIWTNWKAVSFVLRKSPLFYPLGRVFEWPPLARVGDRAYSWIGRHRGDLLGRLSARFLCYRRQRFDMHFFESVAVGVLLIFLVLHHISTLNVVKFKLPPLVQNTLIGLKIDQTWNLFAPYPLRVDGWLTIRGELADGKAVDLWNNAEGEPSITRPPILSQWVGDYRWRKYLSRIVENGNSRQLENLARYYCRSYNWFHARQGTLLHLTIDLHEERTMPDYQPYEENLRRILTWDCLG